MAALPEDVSIDFQQAIDELESAIAEVESRLETTRAERKAKTKADNKSGAIPPAGEKQ